ncbi:MAG TPA: hypothetical protein VF473_09165 [Cyclobacteriaceae bacterium]
MSDYRQASKNNKVLLVPRGFVKEMATRCSLKVELIKDMTPHPTSTNNILTVKE